MALRLVAGGIMSKALRCRQRFKKLALFRSTHVTVQQGKQTRAVPRKRHYYRGSLLCWTDKDGKAMKDTQKRSFKRR